MSRDERILILMPTTRDGQRMRHAFADAGLEGVVCKDIVELCAEIALGAGLALLPEEAVQTDRENCLQDTLRGQPPWSDFPLVVLARERETRGHLIRESMNATLVERPVRGRSLLSVVKAGLRSRRRQYEMRDHLVERKRSEEARALLAAIVESSDDAIVSKNLDGIILSWNHGAEKLFGYTASEAVGRPITLIIPPERLNEEAAILDKLRHGTTVENFETIRVAKSGRQIDISLTISPVRNADGKIIAASKVARDISARKTAEAALAHAIKESESRKRLYEALLASTPDLVYVFSLDYRILYANQALVEMWGAGDPIGKTFLELGYEPWHAELHASEIDQVRTTKQPLRGEVPFHGTHGPRIYDYIFAPVFGGNGEVEAVAGTTRDITDRKAIEEELKDADRKKDDFIALLAHELRNPLAPIRNGLQVIRLAGSDLNTLGKARDMMERQLSQMVRLIDDLLDVSRINRNKMQLRRSRILLTDVVTGAVETARPQIDQAGHELTLSLPAVPIHLDADLVRLSQVFSNLLTNSAKYTPPGGRIWLSAERKGGTVEVSVRDSGIGIPARSLVHIFDMFSQVDRSIERSTGGLGIGLALVKGLVEMHDGSVTAASDGDGMGSVFTVVLPVSSKPLEIDKPATPAPVLNGRRRRVLVVDDNRDGADSLATMLRLMGDDVRIANDGLAAVAVADEFRPEVILMDVGMPNLNGLEATRRIRQQSWSLDTKIIALTGWGQDNDRERSRAAGCDGHLVKPVHLPELENALTAPRREGKKIGATANS